MQVSSPFSLTYWDEEECILLYEVDQLELKILVSIEFIMSVQYANVFQKDLNLSKETSSVIFHWGKGKNIEL